jgi:hypothetical protein
VSLDNKVVELKRAQAEKLKPRDRKKWAADQGIDFSRKTAIRFNPKTGTTLFVQSRNPEGRR